MLDEWISSLHLASVHSPIWESEVLYDYKALRLGIKVLAAAS